MPMYKRLFNLLKSRTPKLKHDSASVPRICVQEDEENIDNESLIFEDLQQLEPQLMVASAVGSCLTEHNVSSRRTSSALSVHTYDNYARRNSKVSFTDSPLMDITYSNEEYDRTPCSNLRLTEGESRELQAELKELHKSMKVHPKANASTKHYYGTAAKEIQRRRRSSILSDGSNSAKGPLSRMTIR
eukprot:CFRG3849T1